MGAYGQGSATPIYCDASTATVSEWRGGCVWQPGPTFGTLFALNAKSGGYNEIVLDANWWRSHMPAAVEAVVGDASVHAALLKAYGLRAADIPLVELDLKNFEAPFRAKG